MRVRSASETQLEALLDPEATDWMRRESLAIALMGTPLGIRPSDAIRRCSACLGASASVQAAILDGFQQHGYARADRRLELEGSSPSEHAAGHAEAGARGGRDPEVQRLAGLENLLPNYGDGMRGAMRIGFSHTDSQACSQARTGSLRTLQGFRKCSW